MIFGKSYWKSTEQGIQREWLLTNGIGGFASGTMIGMNARRYHGLLVASLLPPVERFLIVSAIHEAIVTEAGEAYLHAFQTPDFTAHGEYYLERFCNDPVPEFHYRIGAIQLIKKICMTYGR